MPYGPYPDGAAVIFDGSKPDYSMEVSNDRYVVNPFRGVPMTACLRPNGPNGGATIQKRPTTHGFHPHKMPGSCNWDLNSEGGIKAFSDPIDGPRMQRQIQRLVFQDLPHSNPKIVVGADQSVNVCDHSLEMPEEMRNFSHTSGMAEPTDHRRPRLKPALVREFEAPDGKTKTFLTQPNAGRSRTKMHAHGAIFDFGER